MRHADCMTSGFLQLKASRQVTAPATHRDRDNACSETGYGIDWRAARRAQRACCCTARPIVIAILPPSGGRRHLTDLLFCGHHYRAARLGLAATGAIAVGIDGDPLGDTDWPRLARC